MFLQIQISGDKYDQIQLSVQSWEKYCSVSQELKEQFIQKCKMVCTHLHADAVGWSVFVKLEAAVDL